MADTNSHSVERLQELAGILARCSKVTEFNQDDTQEAWTLADDFIDLDQSFRTFSQELLPKLVRGGLESKQIEEALHDIGEEFRHILYHIRSSKFYKYVDENAMDRENPEKK